MSFWLPHIYLLLTSYLYRMPWTCLAVRYVRFGAGSQAGPVSGFSLS